MRIVCIADDLYVCHYLRENIVRKLYDKHKDGFIRSDRTEGIDYDIKNEGNKSTYEIITDKNVLLYPIPIDYITDHRSSNDNNPNRLKFRIYKDNEYEDLTKIYVTLCNLEVAYENCKLMTMNMIRPEYGQPFIHIDMIGCHATLGMMVMQNADCIFKGGQVND